MWMQTTLCFWMWGENHPTTVWDIVVHWLHRSCVGRAPHYPGIFTLFLVAGVTYLIKSTVGRNSFLWVTVPHDHPLQGELIGLEHHLFNIRDQRTHPYLLGVGCLLCSFLENGATQGWEQSYLYSQNQENPHRLPWSRQSFIESKSPGWCSVASSEKSKLSTSTGIMEYKEKWCFAVYRKLFSLSLLEFSRY